MKMGLLAMGLGLIAAVLASPAAEAQRRGDWYRDLRPYLSRDVQPLAREARLWEEVTRLHSALRRADRRGDLRAREADRFYDRLERVARFLRDDRRLSDREYDRRRDDLEDIARDLHRALPSRYSFRDDGRYSRRDTDRYLRRAADFCDLCGGVCRHR